MELSPLAFQALLFSGGGVAAGLSWFCRVAAQSGTRD